MSSRKQLKHEIQLACAELLNETFLTHHLLHKLSEEAYLKFVARIISVNSDFRSRANHLEPGMKAQKYYHQLIADFNAEAEKIIEDIAKEKA